LSKSVASANPLVATLLQYASSKAFAAAADPAVVVVVGVFFVFFFPRLWCFFLCRAAVVEITRAASPRDDPSGTLPRDDTADAADGTAMAIMPSNQSTRPATRK